MIDDDDVGYAALALSDIKGPFGFLIAVVCVSLLAYAACENEKECAAKTCPSGQSAQLLDHKCLCVTEPSKGDD